MLASPLGQEAQIIMGQSPSGDTYNTEKLGVPLLNGPTEFGPIHPTEKQWTTSPAKLCRAGDILFCVRGATAGRTNVADKEYCIGRGLAAIRARPDKLDERFLHHVLAAGYAKLQARGVGSTFINISSEALSEFDVPIFPLPEQRRIAAILDQADALRAKRRAAPARLDEMARAIFVDMFGDPVLNPHRWKTDRLGSLLTSVDSGWSPVCLDRPAAEGEWGVLKLGAVTKGFFDASQQKALPPRLKPRSEIEVVEGDLLFTRKNTYELVAATAIVQTCRKRLMLSDLIFRLQTLDKEVNKTFLQSLLSYPSVRAGIQRLAGGSAGSMPNISKEKLQEVRVIVPPLDQQQCFERAFGRIGELRRQNAMQLAETNSLFASLQHRAFRGEL